ncbi:hypothetical protein [Streptomyces microflavus]|uniref:hypothetical protein n=1 Tax=Streptomyces microflavus TaxID=1919 RepID=UPI003825975D
MLEILLAMLPSRHRTRLVKAVSVPSVELVCVEQAWQSIYKACSGKQENLALPPPQSGGATAPQSILLSGPQIALVLTHIFRGTRVYSVAPSYERAVYDSVYDAVAAVLDRISLRETDEIPIPPIMIGAPVIRE